MRKLIIFLLISSQLHATTVVNVVNDTTINGTWNLNNSILRISAKISGACTITNAFIEANPFIQIFDTSVNIGTGCRIKEFSVMWYGAAGFVSDNYYAIQKSIDQCKDRFNLYIPRGTYSYNEQLMVANYNSGTGKYQQTSIRMYGEAAMWDDNSGTKLVYRGDSAAIALQLNKGSEISNLVIQGSWVSPGGTELAYFNISEANYTNQAAKGNGQGIWVDPYFDGSNSGSTGCIFHDLYIKNFNTLIRIGNTSGTQNGEIMTFRDVQFGNAKYGVLSSQPQEKMNTFDGLHSWGGIFCIFKLQSGSNYYIKNVNIAGWCVEIFDIGQQSWFPIFISNIYAEHFARIGNIISFLPITIKDCLFDFAYQSQAGIQTLVTANNYAIKFSSCTFRYYGQPDQVLNFSGPMTFENCLFSGQVSTSGAIINTNNGLMNVNGTDILLYNRYDIGVGTSTKITLRPGQ